MTKIKTIFEALEEKRHETDCKEGKHNFIECDEWGATCLYCGKFEKK